MACARCGCGIHKSKDVIALNKLWHRCCFNCFKCHQKLDKCTARVFQGEIFCKCCFNSVLEEFDISSLSSRCKPCRTACSSPSLNSNKEEGCGILCPPNTGCSTKYDIYCFLPGNKVNCMRPVRSCCYIPCSEKQPNCCPIPREVANFCNRNHKKNTPCSQPSCGNPDCTKCCPLKCPRIRPMPFHKPRSCRPCSPCPPRKQASPRRQQCHRPDRCYCCPEPQSCCPQPKPCSCERCCRPPCPPRSCPPTRCPPPCPRPQPCTCSTCCPPPRLKPQKCCQCNSCCPQYEDCSKTCSQERCPYKPCFPPTSCPPEPCCAPPPRCPPSRCLPEPCWPPPRCPPPQRCPPPLRCSSAPRCPPTPRCPSSPRYPSPPRCCPPPSCSPKPYNPPRSCPPQDCKPSPPPSCDEQPYCNSPRRSCNNPSPCNCKQCQIIASCTPLCVRCGCKVYAAEKITLSKGAYHNSCFSCYCCQRCLDIKSVYEAEGEIYCKRCYNLSFGADYIGFGSTLHPC